MHRLMVAVAGAALLGLAAAPEADAGSHTRHRLVVSETSSGKHVPRRHVRLAKGKAECPFCSGVKQR